MEASGVVPEEVIVLETVGSVDDFIVGVRHIDGLEWLGEIEEEDIPPDTLYMTPGLCPVVLLREVMAHFQISGYVRPVEKDGKKYWRVKKKG